MIGEQIKRLREAAGISPSALASAVGCSRGHLSLCEQGHRGMSGRLYRNCRAAIEQVRKGRDRAYLAVEQELEEEVVQ